MQKECPLIGFSLNLGQPVHSQSALTELPSPSLAPFLLLDPVPITCAVLHFTMLAWHVEGLEHDLCGVLSVLGRVEGRLREEEVVVLWLRPQVLEDALLHELLHQVPVLHLTVPDGILQVR